MGNKHSSNKGERQPATDRQNPLNNEGPMNPILFNQVINSVYENSSPSKQMGQSRFSQLSKYTGSSLKKSAHKYDAKLNLNNLSVIMQNQEINGSKNQTSVPFSVVQLSIEPNVLKCINQLDPQFFTNYQSKVKDNDSLWKINSKGFYYKAMEGGQIIIIKPGYLYYGEYIQNGADVIPHNKGKLFTNRGMYQGSFKNGQAHGQGTYSDNILHSRSSGLWMNGQIRKGDIDNEYYTYNGQFVQGIANGEGQIKYKQQKAMYKGHFKEGVYEDEKGFFQSQYYDYSGGFREGRKQGIGCLIEKERYLMGKNKKYRPQEQFQGYFQNDYYKGKKKAGGAE